MKTLHALITVAAALFVVAALLALVGCATPPGRPYSGGVRMPDDEACDVRSSPDDTVELLRCKAQEPPK